MGVLQAELSAVQWTPGYLQGRSSVRCSPVILPISSDILEEKDVCAVRHDLLVQRPCIWCPATLDYMEMLQTSWYSTVLSTIDARVTCNEAMDSNSGTDVTR